MTNPKLFLFTLALSPSLAFAGLDLSNPPGREAVKHTAGSRVDYCFKPNLLPGSPYRKNKLKKDQEGEDEICTVSVYGEPLSNMAACPKLNSTNPGIGLYHLKEKAGGRAKWEAAECVKTDPEGEAKQIAKFKQSITCSYSPSPLAYYHISRVLELEPIVPIAAVRAMDARTHFEYVTKAGKIVAKLYPNPSAIMRRAWTQLWPAAYESKPATIFDTRGGHVWGTVMEQIRGKKLYIEAYKKPGAKWNYDTRYQDFKNAPVYQKLVDPKPVAGRLGNTLAVAQEMIQLKDVSDMLVIDYLLNQQDRMGNVHYLPYFVYVEDGKIKDKKIKRDDDGKHENPEEAAELIAKGAVEVKRMVMADNDCGVAKTNELRAKKILEGVSHLSLTTYQRLLWLNQQMQTQAWQHFFRAELLFTDADLRGTSSNNPGLLVNLANAVKLFKEKCKQGKLQLDLNLGLQLAGQNLKDSRAYCELPANYRVGE